MKSVYLFLFAAILSIGGYSQNQSARVMDIVKFNENVHNFGKIKFNVPVTCDFEITNISKEPIVIERAQASCGCTTPKWPQNPIMPGKTAKLNVGYNAATISNFEKTITIKIAGVDQTAEIKITGEVMDAAAYDAMEKEATAKAIQEKLKVEKQEAAKKASSVKQTPKPVAKPAAKKSK